MAAISNVHMIALGINEHRAGTAIAEGGIAHIAEGICEAWFTPLRWSYGAGDNEMSGCVNLGDMFKGRQNTKGQSDQQFTKAMYIAVAEAFGVDGGFSGADKMAFKRAFAIAAARHAGAPVKFVNETVDRKGRAVKVRAVEVPASYAFKLTDAEGKLTEVASGAVDAMKKNLKFERKAIPEDAELLKRLSAMPVSCVGGSDDVYGKVPSATAIADMLRPIAAEAGLVDAPKPRNGSARSAKFGEALEYVTKCLDLLAGDGDESDFAPSDAIDAKLRSVAERIAAYFAK